MKKILVIEDNENNMYLMQYILKKAGHEVIEAWNGRDGVEAAKNQVNEDLKDAINLAKHNIKPMRYLSFPLLPRPLIPLYPY